MCRLIVSKTLKPQLNLAYEEYLVKNASEEDDIFFLWQNDETVVIGRNQNPWKECNVEQIKKDRINLVRRLTGGGAVFHDKGNLNFTFISKWSSTKIEENFTVIIEALRVCGIDAVFTGKNDLLVMNKKVSGNAFVQEGPILCHHGTLLIDADLSRLADYLTVSDLKLKSKGIESVRSRVSNLIHFNGCLTVKIVVDQLINAFKEFRLKDIISEYVDEAYINHQLVGSNNRYLDWSWNFGSSPEFDAVFYGRFEWGEIEINLMVLDGIITEVRIYSDSNDVTLAKQIELALCDIRFEKDIITEKLATISRYEIKDILNMMYEKMF